MKGATGNNILSGDVDKAPKHPSDFLTSARDSVGSKQEESVKGLGLAPLGRSVTCSDMSPPLPLTRSITAASPGLPSQEPGTTPALGQINDQNLSLKEALRIQVVGESHGDVADSCFDSCAIL